MTLSEPELRTVTCAHPGGLHRLAYWEWGEPRNPSVVVCVHGLTRSGRDFDALAQRLSATHRVVCPDMIGRGRSDRVADPMLYQVPQYVADCVTLIARLDVPAVAWVGTSMGGLIGMGVAALEGSPVRRLVLNDVGPRIQADALQRIGSYLGRPARFGSEQEAAQAIWAISQGFGPHTPEQWLDLTRPLLKPDGSGGFVLRYDPAIAVPFRAITPEIAALGEAALWRAYDSLRQPTLLLRGAQSDLLSPETAQAMTQRGPRARLHEFPGVGHAPMLVQPDQRQVVREFLLAP